MGKDKTPKSEKKEKKEKKAKEAPAAEEAAVAAPKQVALAPIAKPLADDKLTKKVRRLGGKAGQMAAACKRAARLQHLLDLLCWSRRADACPKAVASAGWPAAAAGAAAAALGPPPPCALHPQACWPSPHPSCIRR